MATLNTSAEGPSINKSYQSIVNAPAPSGPTASSPTYGQWALFTVSAPLVSAFQQSAGKESTLKVQSTGEGELEDLIEDFSDGRMQFAFVRVKDPNTTLPKFVLIAWCGAGVPERNKGNFTSHLAAVSKILHGYHVQVTARSESDLTPEGIIRKVSDASGSKYSGDNAISSSAGGALPPVASKPVFTPTQIGNSSRGFNPLGSRSSAAAPSSGQVDEDGWDIVEAPQVTRTQLEKVAPAYKPTKVNMAQLTSERQEPSRFSPQSTDRNTQDNVVRGGYQPIGKVDIAALRRQAQEQGSAADNRPTPVKGSYEPVGKVDIAAIRARAQPSSDVSSPPPRNVSPAATGTSTASGGAEAEPRSLADRSAAFSQSERLTSMPKPKLSNRLGVGASNFTGTKTPAPAGFGAKPLAAAAPVGTASKTFADEGGKTPAQIWAEKKARERGTSDAADTTRPGQPTSPVASHISGGGQWDSGYSGKKWGAVQTTRTGQSAASGISQQDTGDNAAREEPIESSGNVSAIRDRFKNAAPMGSARDEQENEAPPPPMASRPSGARAVPGMAQKASAEEQIPDEEYSRMPTPPAQPPRSPTPESPVDEGSPIRIAQPVSRGKDPELEAPEERFFPPPMPTQSLSNAVPARRDLDEETTVAGNDPARGASQAAAALTFGSAAAANADVGAGVGGKRALIEFDYEKAEDNEIDLQEGEYVTNIDMVDEDWWMGQNSKGESGLFPANYVKLEDGGEELSAAAPSPTSLAAAAAVPAPAATSSARPAAAVEQKPTATSEFDYEAAEENELSFPENAKIVNVEFPDEDWWLGEYNGKQGLFPSNYVKLDD